MSSHPRKQILADLGEAYKRTALVRIKPARGDREIKPGLVFGRRGLQLKQHRTIDQLDMNAPVLDRLDGMGESQAACGLRPRSWRKDEAARAYSSYVLRGDVDLDQLPTGSTDIC